MKPDARRLEELGLNSSAPPGQLLYDGWLLRLAPGKAKRARSVNAVYASRLGLETKVAYCERLYAHAGLPVLFRITPFSEPADLDGALAAWGYGRFDDTSVQSCDLGAAPDGEGASPAIPMDLAAWATAVAELRGSPAAHRESHVARLQGTPLPMRPLAIEADGHIAATGLVIVEDDCAGLFDIVTHDDQRRRGHARTLVAALLRAAREMGARHAYLQVAADNTPARRLYETFGFAERYLYWYRGRDGERE